MGKLLEVKNLTKKYFEGTQESRAVDGVDLEVGEGEFVALMGASGSGKTSLLHLLGGIDRFDGGTVRYRVHGGTPSEYQDVDFSQMSEKAKTMFRRSNIGIVFQQQCLIPDLTVYENIMLPLMLERRHAEKEDIFKLCEQFGLKEHTRKYPSQLSGGQQQRAAILRSVINKPPLLLCDEPTGSLNLAQTKLVMDLLCELNQGGQTIILVTHDMKVAVRGKRVVYIEDGRVEGELNFAEAKPGDAEQELMDFLKERGW